MDSNSAPDESFECLIKKKKEMNSNNLKSNTLL